MGMGLLEDETHRYCAGLLLETLRGCSLPYWRLSWLNLLGEKSTTYCSAMPATLAISCLLERGQAHRIPLHASVQAKTSPLSWTGHSPGSESIQGTRYMLGRDDSGAQLRKQVKMPHRDISQHDSIFSCCRTVPLTASMLLQAIRQGRI